MRGSRISNRWMAVIPILSAILFTSSIKVKAQQETVLYSFGSSTDGATPYAGLVLDSAGNLYGTTYKGGLYGDGTAFELSPNTGGGWTETILHNFNNNGIDGSGPRASLIIDSLGNLYGTTEFGGPTTTSGSPISFTNGTGTAFELSPSGDGAWTETIMHYFGGKVRVPGGAEYPIDGNYPYGGLVFDQSGNLYGTTLEGGNTRDRFNAGTVFELSPVAGVGWMETILHSFSSRFENAGSNPSAGLIIDASGNLYGTTSGGGSRGCQGGGCGTAFELTPSAHGWEETGMHIFDNGGSQSGGIDPAAGLIFDSFGNLYGTTVSGGSHGCGEAGCGVVFELTDWNETVLLTFDNNGSAGLGGVNPYAGLTFDAFGNLYGTTYSGGTNGCNGSACGVVFELTPSAGGWTETVLHSFQNDGVDGNAPVAAVVIDALGNVYGTTSSGGAYGYGTVFKITP